MKDYKIDFYIDIVNIKINLKAMTMDKALILFKNALDETGDKDLLTPEQILNNIDDKNAFLQFWGLDREFRHSLPLSVRKKMRRTQLDKYFDYMYNHIT